MGCYGLGVLVALLMPGTEMMAAVLLVGLNWPAKRAMPIDRHRAGVRR